MNNLTTRKIVLGTLMTLVLAFSVQGIADALTFGTTRTGDLQTIVRGGTFSVTFSVTLVPEARKSAYTDYTATYTSNDVTYYYIDSNSDGDRDTNELQVTASTAFHYNNEAVRINVSGAGARITSIGTIGSNGNNPITPATSITLRDGGSGAEELVESVVVNCSTTTYGEITITASDATPSEDYPSGVRRAPNFVLTNYAVQYNNAVGPTRTIRLAGVTNGVAIGYDNQRNQPIYNGDGSHYPVTYTVAGGGMIYIQEGDRETSPTTSLSTSTAAKVLLSMGGSTNMVTAVLGGSFETSEGIYIFGNPQLEITGSSDGQSAAANAPLAQSLQVKLKDNAEAGVAGVPIKFDVTDTSPSGGILSPAANTTIVDASNEEVDSPIPGSTMYVRTETGGVASISFQLGTIPGEQTITAGALGIARLTETIKVTATPTKATRQLFADDIDRHGTTNIYTLVARVENGGKRDADEPVMFTTTKGFLTGDTDTAKTVTAVTNAAGKARVTHNIGDSSGSVEVVASISVTTGTLVTQLQEVTFNVRGGSSGQQQQQQQQQQPATGSLNITVSGTGATRSVTVNAVSAAGTPTAIPAVLTGTATSTQTIITGTATEITLPTAPGSYTLTATASVAGYNPDTETITVAGPTSLGTISISQIGTPTNGVQTFSITVRRTDGTTPAPLTVTVSGTGFTSSSVPTANGSGAVNITLPTTAGLYTLTARATGYTSGPTTVRIAGTGQQQQQQQPAQQQPAQQQPTVSEPDSISIIGPSTRSGTVNEALDTPLIVQVLDDDGDGLEGARVFYRVTGRGRISDGSRGGRSVGVVTDDDGYARANFTPTAGGSSTVRVNTDDVSRIVTFTITTGSAPTPRGPGTGVPSGTSVSPVVHVAAASRPPMLWVDGGAIYALVGASPQRFAASVDNALNITVGGGKVYWTEKTGESGGTINSANLNGSDVTELTSIKAVPMGIAVDVAGSQLYWTNSRGRIQSADLDGSGITNVMQNLPSPMDLALAGGNAYWTQGNGSVRFVNLRGQKVVRNISTGTDTPGSLVIGGGKVYWTEMTGESGGTVNSANLNGTGATPLASILAAPMGIAVDGSRSKLYWTNSRGRVQSANLDGSGIKNVVSGLGSPGELVLSNSISAPTTATTTTTRTTTTASNKYDVNGDGSVNNADSDAITVAIAAGATDAKYDVNGDGTVNVFDLVEIIANRDPGAAGAPTLFGMKMSAAQIDSLQEQIDLLIAMNDRSPAALRTLIYLQQLLVTARPEKTQLLANYPNPFNPETWIPYELATDTDVRLTIYNTQGVVIRSLQLGHQSAGYYTGRDRAAYWDGRNVLGERVASGLYFYQLETDEMSLMRKMVILK